ncbi:MAG: 4-hydroxybenzoate octaprenyltransferase [Blastochloris sp.]|nr:4-hydroxybenzoate octaprenyltransferase [Blastochloris sp.]
MVCMVGARTAAMCFNRLADWQIDQENPRTMDRHRLVSRPLAMGMFAISTLLLVLGAQQLNPLCLVLCPLAILLITVYSLTKRFTAYSHLFLGLALAAAPMGAWAAVRGELWSLPPYVLALAVLCWVAGFDVIYATMDMEFDRRKGLHSIPARFGQRKALGIAQALHGVAALGFALFGWAAGLGWSYAVAWLLAAGCLVWEHRISESSEPNTINRAFFQINAVVGAVLLLGVGLEVLIFK